MDWKRGEGKRLSRRRLLGAAGIAGASAVVGGACFGGDGKPSTPAPLGTAPQLPPNAKATPAESTKPVDAKAGETLRYSGYVTSDGVYDPHKTQSGPFYGHQSLIFSRLLSYTSQAAGTMAADLAASMPEQPDPLTFIFNVRGNARWDERAPLKGRPVTSRDVKASIIRQLAGDAGFVRKANWVMVDSIETPTDQQVVFKLKEPLATMLAQFADVNAFVVPEEMASESWSLETQLGSGPFRFVEWNEGKFASVGRNPNWYGGGGKPYLDGLTVVQPKDTAEVEAKLRTKALDAVFVGRRQADSLKQARPDLVETPVGMSRFYGMRFSVRQAPYTDVRFRSAVSAAVDRRAMVQQFFQGSGDINPWVSWPMTRWTMPQEELTSLPGYRAGSGGRDADIKEARALLAAVAGSVTIPADNPLFVPDDAEASLHLGSVIQQQLAENLGLKVTVYPLPIGDLVRRMFNNDAPWVAGPDDGWIDLDDWLYPYFHSAGTKNTFPMRDTDLDALIESQRKEFDEAKRREIGLQAQRRIMTANAGLNFCSEKVITLSWPYVKGFPVDTTDGYQHRFADCWIDRDDATFRGR